MTSRKSTAKHRFVTEDAIKSALGRALSAIKSQDGMTWVDMGIALGKSDDQASSYASGFADMPVTAYYRAKALFNGRFTREADALIGYAHSDETSDHEKQSSILKAALHLSIALEDGVIDNTEIAANRKTLECARDAIDALLAKPLMKGVA